MNKSSDRNFELVELAQMHPDKSEFYLKMKANKDVYEEELKKLYNQGLTLWFQIACLKLEVAKMGRYTEKIDILLKNNAEPDSEN